MGTRLLLRTTRRVQLTTDGQLCYARCRELLADMEEFDGLFRQGADLGTTAGRHAKPDGPPPGDPALPDFLAQHPALQLMLSSTDRRVDLVREGLTAWCGSGRPGPQPGGRPLGHYRQINCASAGYLARHGVPPHPGDLAGRSWSLWSQVWCRAGAQRARLEYLAEDGHRALLPMAGALMVNDSETYLAAALAGLGIIQMPRVGVESLLAGASW
jgi:DNA-binding transcriptional LysR family regulator